MPLLLNTGLHSKEAYQVLKLALLHKKQMFLEDRRHLSFCVEAFKEIEDFPKTFSISGSDDKERASLPNETMPLIFRDIDGFIDSFFIDKQHLEENLVQLRDKMQKTFSSFVGYDEQFYLVFPVAASSAGNSIGLRYIWNDPKSALQMMCSEVKMLIVKSEDAFSYYYPYFNNFFYEEFDADKLLPFTLKMFDDVLAELRQEAIAADEFKSSKNEICKELAKNTAACFSKAVKRLKTDFRIFAVEKPLQELSDCIYSVVFSDVDLHGLFRERELALDIIAKKSNVEGSFLEEAFGSEKKFAEMCEAVREFIKQSPVCNAHAFCARITY